MTKRISITEVGLRDGLQSEETLFPTAKKVELANRLIEAGIRRLEATSFVSPRAIPQLADAEDLIDGIHRVDGLVVEALVPNARGAERATATGVDVWVAFASASETHSQANSNASIELALDRIRPLPELATQAGADVYGAIACAFDCPFEGQTPHSSVLRVAKSYWEMGMRCLKLGDTIGTASPSRVKELVNFLARELPDMDVVLHLHDTRSMGLACALAGIEAGITRIESAIGGLGGCPFAPGATGNIATEDLVHMLHLEGVDTGIDLPRLIEAGRFLDANIDSELPARLLRASPVGTLAKFDESLRATG